MALLGLNDDQVRVLSSWPRLLSQYCVNRWMKCALAILLAGIVGSTIAIAYRDQYLQCWIAEKIRKLDLLVAFKGMNHFGEYGYFLVGASCAFVLMPSISGVRRLLRSWHCGLWSGLATFCFFVVFIDLLTPVPFSKQHVEISFFFIAGFTVLDFFLYLKNYLHRFRRALPAEVLKQRQPQSSLPRHIRTPDDPIESWTDDLLRRSSLVDTLKVKLLVGNAPVIALRGHFGDGKTSVLNLLRKDLKEMAITVSFTTWLPGSEKTLVNDLLADIGKECRKEFIAPGLSKSINKYARVLAGGVPHLQSASVLFPDATQRDEIKNLGELLEGLPKRIVVLLDEVDRMRKKEILVLLKLIRGVSSLPNLSFVCAFDREQVETVVCGSYDATSREFFEKFFPVAVDLPPADGALLKQEFVNKLTNLFYK